MPKRLTGKTVLVVGAAGNLGPVWVEAFLREGAMVLGVGLGTSKDVRLTELGRKNPSQLALAEVDITQDTSREEMGQRLGHPLGEGTLDGVVFNSGIDSLPGTGRTALEDYGRDEWDTMFRVNVVGVVATLNTLLPAFKDPSSAVMLGSLYGIVSPKPDLYSHFNEGVGSVKHPAYGASKAALVATARQYATHLAPRGIRVNTLTLGGVAAGQDEEFVRKFENHVPQATMLKTQELTGSMIFLLSDDSRPMTGHNLIVDGGFTAW